MDEIRYRAAEGFMLREIAEEYLLVPIGRNALRMNGLVTTTETGAFLYQLLSKPLTEGELVRALAAEYEMQEEDLTEDVRDFLEDSVEKGTIVKEC